MRLKLKVDPTGATTATVVFSQEQIDRIRGAAGKSRVPVAIVYRGSTFRTSISIYRGQWMMVVNKAMRDGGLMPGNEYTVDIGLDAAERTVEVPADFAAAMHKAGVRRAFDSLSYTNRREQVRLIEEAKKPETRRRRIDSAIEKLGGEDP